MPRLALGEVPPAEMQSVIEHQHQALREEKAKCSRTEAELRTSEAKFRALAQSAPAAIFICEHDRVTYCNAAASEMTGYSADELCGANLWATLAANRPVSNFGLAAREGAEASPARAEFKILTKHSEVRWLDITEATLEFAGTPTVLHIALDITERKQAVEALKDSQQLLKLVLETLPVGVAVMDLAGDIILSNAAVDRVWGKRITQGSERWAQSKGWWHDSGKLIIPSEWASARALSTGQTSLNELLDIVTFAGDHKTIQNSAAPIHGTDGRIMGAVIVNEDVTDRVRANKALLASANRLQQLSRRLLSVQEDERRHLSRELHDEFGQLLATVSMHLQAAKSSAEPATRANLDESIALLQRAGAQLRTLALELRPMLLETAGLEATLRWLAEQHRQRTGITTEVLGHAGDVPSEVANACFRVAQEALTNIVRHAAARHVWLELSQSEGSLSLVVRDDGLGFDVPSTLERAAGDGNLGLLGMRERVQILGGKLTLFSEPGRGTLICVSLPLADSSVAASQRSA